jgi:hypothetical protein
VHSLTLSGPSLRRLSPARIVAAMAAMLAVSAVLLGVLSSMASAAVPGLERVDRTTSTDSSLAKSRFASCPTGKQLLGAGADVLGAPGQVFLDGIRLNSPLNNMEARAFEDQDGTPLSWSLNAYAMCANPIPGLVQVNRTSADNSFAKSFTVPCPTGKQLISLGAETSGANGEVVIDDLIPNSTLTAANVTGFEDADGAKDSWTLTGHAICADPLPGLEVKPLATPAQSVNGQGVGVACSAGKRLLGVGGEITGGLGKVVMTGLTPGATLTGATVQAAETQGGTSNNWSIRGYAICASA